MMLGDGSFRAGTGWCGLRGMRVGHEIGGRRQMQLCPVGGFFGSSSRSIMINVDCPSHVSHSTPSTGLSP